MKYLLLLIVFCHQAEAQEVVVVYPDSTHTEALDLLSAVETGKAAEAWMVEIRPKERYMLDAVREMHDLAHEIYGEDHHSSDSRVSLIRYQPCVILDGNLYTYPKSDPMRWCYRVNLLTR